MSGRYLTELADWLRAGGCVVVEEPGWQTRARSSGGYQSGSPICFMWHHTASQTTARNDVNYICYGDNYPPISNLYIARDGAVWVCAAGATNTNGKGNPMTFSHGVVPLDSMNLYAVGCEIGNNGVGEHWPQVQIDAAFKASLAITNALGLEPTDVAGHADYAVGRKIDPARAEAVDGPWRPSGVNSSGTWALVDIRNECVARNTLPEPPEPPIGEDDMLRKVLVPRLGPNDPQWWPWLATFDSGAVRPLVSNEPEPASGKADIDIGQYKTLCAWAGINLESQP